MGCIYNNWKGGCYFAQDKENEKDESYLDSICVDEHGNCRVDDDPDPGFSCGSYQYDGDECSECGEPCDDLDECKYCGYCFNCSCIECECEFE